MKRFLILLCFVGCCGPVIAQKYFTRTGKVSFFSATPLENIEAINNEMAGIMDLTTGEVAFIVPVKSFKFEKGLMQEHFNENYMESDKFPKATLNGKMLPTTPTDFSKNGTYPVNVAGTLSIHGVSQKVNIPGTLSIEDGKIRIFSKFKVKNKDYNIKIPSLVAKKIAEEIEVTVNTMLHPK